MKYRFSMKTPSLEKVLIFRAFFHNQNFFMFFFHVIFMYFEFLDIFKGPLPLASSFHILAPKVRKI